MRRWLILLAWALLCLPFIFTCDKPASPAPGSDAGVQTSAADSAAGATSPAEAVEPKGNPTEFRVTVAAAGDQFDPAVAMNAGGGNFVAVWTGDGVGEDVLFRLFAANGFATTGDLLANATTDGDQVTPAAAMDADGGFVVVWSSDQDDAGDIYGRRFNASGQAQDTEFRVNTYTTSAQTLPAIAMDPAGDFVVVWVSSGEDGSDDGVFGQRFDASGTPQGTEFQANTHTTDKQTNPSVAMDAAGDFVVVWQSFGQDGDGWGVFAQRYDATGAAQGAELQVNPSGTGDQTDPHVAMGAAGEFAVVWGVEITGAPIQCSGQRFDATGARVGGVMQINTYTFVDIFVESIAMDAAGEFVVTWHIEDPDHTHGLGIFARLFDSSGVAALPELTVNNYVNTDQRNSAVGISDNADIITIWQTTPAGGGNGIDIHGNLWTESCFRDVQCNDQNPCTDDSCVLNFCRHDPNVDPCDDGVFCNGADTCSGGACSVHSLDACPDDGLWCNGVETCDEDTRTCGHAYGPDNLRCPDDGKFCDGAESCDEVNDQCVSSGSPCQPTDTCDEENDICISSDDDTTPTDDDSTDDDSTGDDDTTPTDDDTASDDDAGTDDDIVGDDDTNDDDANPPGDDAGGNDLNGKGASGCGC